MEAGTIRRCLRRTRRRAPRGADSDQARSGPQIRHFRRDGGTGAGMTVRARRMRGFRTADGETEMWVGLHPGRHAEHRRSQVGDRRRRTQRRADCVGAGRRLPSREGFRRDSARRQAHVHLCPGRIHRPQDRRRARGHARGPGLVVVPARLRLDIQLLDAAERPGGGSVRVQPDALSGHGLFRDGGVIRVDFPSLRDHVFHALRRRRGSAFLLATGTPFNAMAWVGNDRARRHCRQ